MQPGESSRVVAWLCCSPMPPIPLGHTPGLSIGRDESCALTLPHKQVSRVHAAIKVHAGALQLTDEGSSNGTFVNGRRMTTAPLQVGDRLAIGPYELAIRSNEEMLEVAKRTTHSTTNVMRRVRSDEAMAGRIDEISVPELLHQLEFNHKTGVLVVASPEGGGRILVRDGAPLWATFGDETGEEAIIAATGLRRGRFTLVGKLPADAGERRVERSISAILFEASRRHDEAGAYAYADDADPAAQTSPPDDEDDDGFKDTRDWERFWKP